MITMPELHDFIYNNEITEGAGLKGAIDIKTAYLIVKYFTKDINKEISNIKVDDQTFKIGDNKIRLKNINFGISNYSHERVKINFEHPNLIHLFLQNIKAWGKFNAKFKLLIVKLKESVNFDIKDLSVEAKVKIKSKKVNDRLFPDAEVIYLNYYYDFDFKLSSSLGKLISLFKSHIKDLIRKEIDKVIRKEINHGLQIGLNKIPMEIKVDKKRGLVIDYSLISTPFIQNNFILFNSYARFINKNIKETQDKDNYFLPFKVPSYDLLGKASQVYVSDYVINTALFTFFKSKDLEILITPDMIPKNLPIKLNTSWLGIIFKDISNVFGEDIPVNIRLIVSENPQMILKEKMISFILPTNIEVLIQGFEGVAVKFRTTFFVDAEFKVFEDCKISGNIKNLTIEKTKIVWGYTEDENFSNNIEKQFNTLKIIALPFINIFVLKNMHFDLPVIRGIKFTDLTISHHENFVIVNYNFNYNEQA